MKRLIAALVLLAMLLPGCSAGLAEDRVEFFYCRSDDTVLFDTADGVIAPETRNLTNRDLTYLLGMYLRGPQDSQLRSPFPLGCRLLEAVREEDTLSLTLDATFAQLENLELTLACACLVRTCAGLTDAEQFFIQSDSPDKVRSVRLTIRRDQLLLEDFTPLPTELNHKHN